MTAGRVFPMPPSGSVGYAHGGGQEYATPDDALSYCGQGCGHGAGLPSAVAYCGQGCGQLDDPALPALSYW